MGLDRHRRAAAAVSRCFLHPERAASCPVQQSLLHAHGEIPANVSVATLSPFLHSHENLLPYRVKTDDGFHGKRSQNNITIKIWEFCRLVKCFSLSISFFSYRRMIFTFQIDNTFTKMWQRGSDTGKNIQRKGKVKKIIKIRNSLKTFMIWKCAKQFTVKKKQKQKLVFQLVQTIPLL